MPEHAIDNRHLVAAGPCKQSTFTAIAGQCQRRYNVFHRLSVIFDQEDFIRYVASRSHYSFLPKSECARAVGLRGLYKSVMIVRFLLPERVVAQPRPSKAQPFGFAGTSYRGMQFKKTLG